MILALMAQDPAIPAHLCKGAFWDRIYEWQVVMAVALIIAGWTSVQLGRMYFMWKAATARNSCCDRETG